MVHREIYNTFKTLMPFYGDKTVGWFPHGYNKIRVQLNTKEEFIFSWFKDGSWRFETLKSYLKHDGRKEKNRM